MRKKRRTQIKCFGIFLDEPCWEEISSQRGVTGRCGQQIQRIRGGVRKIKAVLSGARGGGWGPTGWTAGCGGLQSFNEPGNSLVNVCQRSIFLSLFLRQSNQCLSRSPFALIPRDTPPERKNKGSMSHLLSTYQTCRRFTMCHIMKEWEHKQQII